MPTSRYSVDLEEEWEQVLGPQPPKKREPRSQLTKEADAKRKEEQARPEHAKRVELLLDRGWQQASPTTWRKDTSDPRWSETSSVEISAETPEDASRAARFKQVELDALAKARAEQ
jgi:hypothetical protein